MRTSYCNEPDCNMANRQCQSESNDGGGLQTLQGRKSLEDNEFSESGTKRRTRSGKMQQESRLKKQRKSDEDETSYSIQQHDEEEDGGDSSGGGDNKNSDPSTQGDASASGEPELTTEELIARAKREYNKERKIIIRNVPPVTYEEVKEFIGGHSISNIVISKKSRHAIVTLMNGEDAEEIVEQLSGKQLLDTDVTVSLHPSDKMLCLTNLPEDCLEMEVHKLLLTYGPMEKFFLMRCEETGESKNYAIFEYCHNKEKSTCIKEGLNCQKYKNNLLACDFIEENLVASYDKLNSKCLLIDGLPKNFKDTAKLKDMFSTNQAPIYCQIVMKENESQECAIVEYATAEAAEATWKCMRDTEVETKKVAVSFCIPGSSAVSIYNKIVQQKEKVASPFQAGAVLNSIKSGLLPDPVFPNPSMMSNPLVKGLANQNPKLLEQFHQALQLLQKTYIHQTIMRNAKPVTGLLGPGPNVSFNPLMNSNMQLGLIILLALQMQGQRQQLFTGPLANQLNMLTSVGEQSNFQAVLKGQKPSLLGDPMTAQANILVQNLMSQMNKEPSSDDKKASAAKRQNQDVNPLPTGFNEGNAALPKPVKVPFTQTPVSDVQKIQNLNIQQLMALGQLMSTMQNSNNLQGLAANLNQGSDKNTSQTGAFISNQQQKSNWGGSPSMNIPSLANAIGKPGLLPSPNQKAGSSPGFGNFNQNMVAAANFMRNLQVLAAAQQMASNKGNTNSNQRTTPVSKDKTAMIGAGSLLGSPPVVSKSNSSSSFSAGRSGSLNSSYTSDNRSYSDTTSQRLSRGTYSYDTSKRSSLLNEPEASQSNQSSGSYVYDRMSSGYSTSRGTSSYNSQPRTGQYSSSYNYQTGNNVGSSSSLVPSTSLGTGTTSATTDYSSTIYNNQYGTTSNDQYYDNYSNYYDNQTYHSNYYDQNEGDDSDVYNSAKSQATTDYYNKDLANSYTHSGYSDNYTGSNATASTGQYEGIYSNYGNNTDSSTGYWGSSTNTYGTSSYSKGAYTNDTTSPSYQSSYSNYTSPTLSSTYGSTSNYGTSSYSSHYGTSTSTTSLTSPIGQKRSYSHLLPPPEASPEGAYVGQHSQGIGGHYADSYGKRKRYDTSVTAKGSSYY
ncbi:ribonucleoprotein PTB-binding 1 isoform X3 [Octopus sinensis]|uniref:Ribonucleoprotein PTB-binding 1 isoform X3 n=1 Tax=Octopus sinensis TaxID=2607531 RepID=A0A7E6EP72_9MOLL|nr:ribonucleoprotein PTB-binding 1 isoform X3 [Octopus sinensis]